MSYGVIYCLRHIETGRHYVGKTRRDPKRRWWQHISRARGGDKSFLYSAIRKYGSRAFTLELCAHGESLEDLNRLEQEWIIRLNTIAPNGFNLSKGGDGGIRHPSTNDKFKAYWADPLWRASRLKQMSEKLWTPEVAERISQSNKGKIIPEELRLRWSAIHKGKKRKPHTPEVRERISAAMRGVPRPYARRAQSIEDRAKKRIAAVRRYQNVTERAKTGLAISAGRLRGKIRRATEKYRTCWRAFEEQRLRGVGHYGD